MTPFGALEWNIAWRYLRSRRRETFVSVITTLSLIGITLGVATLIIVMAVMNGFRAELFNKILGVSGHVLLQPIDGPLTDYRAVPDRIEKVRGVEMAIPFVEGQALVSGKVGSSGAMVRGLEQQDFDKLTFVSDRLILGDADTFGASKGVMIGSRLASQPRPVARRLDPAHQPQRRGHPLRRDAADRELPDPGESSRSA